MARRITVKKILSGIPNITKLIGLSDVNDSGLSETNGFLRYDSDNQNFKFVSLASITSGVSSVNSATGDLTIAGAGTVSVGTVGTTITITGSGGGAGGGVDSATVNTLIAAADTHDSSAVQGQIDSAVNQTLVRSFIDQSFINTFDTHDSAAVVGQINSAYVRPLARAALVAGTNITYDSATGVIASTASGGTGTDSATVVSIADSRIGVASIGDLSDVDLTGIATNRILKWDGSKFVAAVDVTGSGGAGIALTDLSANDAGGFGSFAYNNVSGVFTYTGADSADVKTVTNIPYGNLTGTPTIPTVDSATVQPLARAAIVAGTNITYDSGTGVISSTASGGEAHDSSKTQAQIDSSIGVLNFADSGTVAAQISDALQLGDNESITFGNDSDFKITHNGSHTVLLDQGTGDLFIEASKIHLAHSQVGNPIFLTTGQTEGVQIFDSTGDLRLHSTDAGVSVFAGLKLDGNDVLTTGSTIDAATLDTINSTSFLRSDVKDQKTAGSLVMNDGVAIKFGTDSDHSIREVSGNLEVNTTGSGLLKMNTAGLRVHNEAGTENQILATENSGVTLYFDGNQKALTRSDGFEVTGHLVADSIQTTHIDIFGEITNKPTAVNVGGTQTTVKSLAHNNVASSITYNIHLKDINGTTTKGETSFTTVICTLDSDLNTAFTEFGTLFTGDSSFGSFIVEADATNIDLKFTRRSTRDGAIRVAASKTVVI